MLAQDHFRRPTRRFAGLDYFGRPVEPAPSTEPVPLPQSSMDREKMLRMAVEAAKAAGLPEAAIADVLKQAGASVEEIRAFVTVHLETQTGTSTTTATVPTSDPIKPPPAPSISPTTIGIGIFVAWLIFK